MSRFALHPKLASDTVAICDRSLCRLLLMNDRRYPWLVLVPRREDITEMIDLPRADLLVLTDEVAHAGSALRSWASSRGRFDKLNIASIGNIVPQLHIHIVARSRTDFAWPGPVWGNGEAERYGAGELERVTAGISRRLESQ